MMVNKQKPHRLGPNTKYERNTHTQKSPCGHYVWAARLSKCLLFLQPLLEHYSCKQQSQTVFRGSDVESFIGGNIINTLHGHMQTC